MHNTHLTKKHKTYFSLLVIFFMLLSWSSTNASQAVMKESLQQKPDAVEINQNNDEQNGQNISSKIKKFVRQYKLSIATGVTIAAGITLAYSYLKPVAGGAPLSANSGPSTLQPTQSSTVVSSAQKPLNTSEVTEQMINLDYSMTSSTEDISASLKAIFKIAWASIGTTTTVPAPVAVPPAASTTTIPISPSAAAQEGANQQSMWRTLYNAATKYPRVAAALGLGSIGCGLYKYGYQLLVSFFGLKIGKRTIKNGASGIIMAAPLAAPFLTASQILPFTFLAAPAAIIGNKLFQCSGGHEKLENFVTDECTKLLPYRDTMKDLYPTILPGKEIVDNFFNNHWGSAPDDSGNTGNDAGRAAGYIGTGIADLVGSFLGVVGLLIIFKFVIWYYPQYNNSTPEQAPGSTNATQKEVKQQQQAPKKATTDLGDSLFLHIIYALGLADMVYTLVDKVIEKLENDAEKYTQHQRYNPKSKFTEIKEKVTGTFGSIAARWPFN